MQFLVYYFDELMFMLTFGGMALFVFLEIWIPRRTPLTDQSFRLINNVLLALFNYSILISYAILLGKVAIYFQPETTLVSYFQLSTLSTFIIILISLDFVGYWIHRAFHTLPWLWQFHAVHHTDTEVDVTTSHRQSPIEAILGSIITFPLIVFIGATPLILVVFLFFHKVIELYAHSNIHLPESIDNILRKIIVTPDFHRMHHFSDRKYTDSNFSVVFPLFDYLFSTATRWSPSELPKVELGIEQLRNKADNRLDRLLLTPFLLKK
ncbi:MAG: sterol desaturase/sphingolipid hydroxylase (fatty acid hydroxylase superfamily) [Cocleimonas sp.]|jgi:sterol desaturase/sphingolipid hydroxylase (fatty acid hydroxylase superfamily)